MIVVLCVALAVVCDGWWGSRCNCWPMTVERQWLNVDWTVQLKLLKTAIILFKVQHSVIDCSEFQHSDCWLETVENPIVIFSWDCEKFCRECTINFVIYHLQCESYITNLRLTSHFSSSLDSKSIRSACKFTIMNCNCTTSFMENFPVPRTTISIPVCRNVRTHRCCQ